MLHASAVPSAVLKIVHTLKTLGYQAVVVGGAVRDALLRQDCHDWDVATDALPDKLMEIFPRAHPTGLKHGTVTIVEENEPYEVTSFRGEGEYLDGRRPEHVIFGVPLHEDLSRRDLTCNAIAWDPVTHELFDPFGGAKDIQARIIRAVGEPQHRFDEDGLRPMRAIRLATKLGFAIEPATLAAIPNSLETFRKVSYERIRDEFMKTLAAPRPSRGLRLYLETGLLEVFLPEILAQLGCTQNHHHHRFDVWEHTLRVVDATIGPPLWRLAALLHDIAKPQTRTEDDGDVHFYRHEFVGADVAKVIGQRLHLSNKEIDILVHLVAQHMFAYSPELDDAAMRRMIRRLGEEHIPAIAAIRRGDTMGKGKDIPEGLAKLSRFVTRVEKILTTPIPMSPKDLAIKGTDLAALGVPQGPSMGRILKLLLERVVADPSCNTKETLLEMAKELIAQ